MLYDGFTARAQLLEGVCFAHAAMEAASAACFMYVYIYIHIYIWIFRLLDRFTHIYIYIPARLEQGR